MPSDRLSSTLAALADPTRRAILSRLASGEATVTDLAAPFSMTLPAISRHLKVLRNAGLITRGREAQWRPCRLEAAPLKDVADYVDQYRKLWDGRLDRLGDYLREVQSKGAEEAGHAVSARAVTTARETSKPKRKNSSRTTKGAKTPTQKKVAERHLILRAFSPIPDVDAYRVQPR